LDENPKQEGPIKAYKIAKKELTNTNPIVTITKNLNQLMVIRY
jgi:hypothetical protein